MRILFVAMGQSIHTSRWIGQIADQGWDIHVFDFLDASVCPELSRASTYTVYPPPKGMDGLVTWKSDYPFRRGAGFVRRNFPEIIQRTIFPPRERSLIKLIQKIKPDIIHSLEMQNESYPLLQVKEKLGGFEMPWIYSCWGNDIYHFGKQPEHVERIMNVLASCDYLIADCERDVELAERFGFNGELLGIFPTAGGYEVENLRREIEIPTTSDRKTIALKGYQHWQGRALVALEALKMCRDQLSGFTLEVYLPVPTVVECAREFAQTCGVELIIHEQTLNIEIIRLFGRARIGFSMSVTDGSPNAMLEAMIMGAFPVQSDTVSTAEWIVNGENGLLVPPEDPEAASISLKRALTDDAMVNSAAELNRNLMLRRIDRERNKPLIVKIYEDVFRQGKNKRPMIRGD